MKENKKAGYEYKFFLHHNTNLIPNKYSNLDLLLKKTNKIKYKKNDVVHILYVL